MKWITASDLARWSDRQDARLDLPELVGDLIRATAEGIATFRFPAGDSGNVRGFDGHLESDTAGFNVPQGTSYWEIKTSGDAWGEGLQDFRKRSDQLKEDQRAAATFVFVSSRIWDSSRSDRKIEDWIEKCKSEARWRDVRCLDAVALESWLDQCPAVAARFARKKIGLMPQRGARSTDEFWDEFRHLFARRLDEDILLADREKFSGKLIEALMCQDGATFFISDSPDEVTAFGVATIRAAEPKVRAFLEARTIVVDDMEAGRELLACKNLNFFLREQAAERAGLFAEKAPALVPLGRQQRGGKGELLNRPTAEAMGAALAKMGYEQREAIQLARGAGRSLAALRRQIPGGDVPPPKWLDSAAMILPAILVGAWDQNNEMDRSVLQELSQATDYYAFEKRLRPFLTVADPPVDRIGTVWAVRAPMDAFLNAGSHVGDDILGRLRAVIERVFGHIPPRPDPKAVVQLNPATLDGYSEWLRDGLATTLLQIAVWDKLAEMPITGSGQAFANQVVAEIPGLSADARVLASLKDQLPYLAEAAPDPLLSALESMLGGGGNLLRPIFDEIEGFIHPVSQHTGLLWALETIAWDPDYFDRAVIVLAGLAALDPGGKLANRPINSLASIFLAWYPNTKASVGQRIAALARICETFPQVGWDLLVKLLPTTHGTATDTARPRLREAGSGEVRVTHAEYWEEVAAVVQQAIALVDQDPLRWQVLISFLPNFTPTDRSVALAALDATLHSVAEDSKKALLDDLRHEMERHERFSDAKWALPPDQLQRMRTLVDKYTPDDPLEKARIIFSGWGFDQKGNRDDKERVAAVAAILERLGPEGLITLGKQIRNPYDLIQALDSIDIARKDLDAAADLGLSEKADVLTLGLISLTNRKFGSQAAKDWIRAARAGRTLSDRTVATLLTALPDNQDTWTFAQALGSNVEADYWLTKNPSWLQGDSAELLEAIDTYMHFGRGIAALDTSLRRLSKVPSSKILEILEMVVSDLNSGTVRNDTMVGYAVEQAFKALDSRTDVSDEDIARREVMLFPLLEHTQHRMRIFKVMAENPDVYFEVVKAVFRADDEPQRASEVTERERAVWRLNYSILSKFDYFPGTTGTGIDTAALSSWISRLRDLATAGRRSAITDQYIGHILARSKMGDDGAWPSITVRDQIEALRSENVERGIAIERFNMRGAHFRAMYAGGDDERASAKQYNDYAATMTAWPRTQALLRSIARNWEVNAARQDEWAEQRKARS
jgi:hypothetical protein